MKKSLFCVLLFLLFSFFAFANNQEEVDPTKPIPSKDYKYGLISISGNLGLLYNANEELEDSAPFLKLGFHYNFSEHLSVAIGGGITKYKGPASFVLEDEGIFLGLGPEEFIEEVIIKTSDIEETWYSASFTVNLLKSGVRPYFFAGLKYVSLLYEQEINYRFSYQEEGQYLTQVRMYALNYFGAFAGGGLKISLTDYMELQLEGEWSTFFDSDVFTDKIVGLLGFTFTI